MSKKIGLFVMAMALVATNVVSAPKKDDATPPSDPPETKEHRDARMAWWREAKFGMFIHWGLYAVPAGTYEDKKIGGIGEWIMKNAKIPVARYAEYAKEFNPVKFNAEEWVKIAKDAGMKYMVITSKHHDGFAMFHSKASPYNIYDATPFKRDPLEELAVACRKEGIKLGFYYSQAQDWHHPGGGVCGKHWDTAQDGDMLGYVKTIAVPQVKEILANYGPDTPAVLWWDTPCGMTKEMADPLYAATRSHPNIILNNRLGGGYKGDTETPEQHIPAGGYKDRDWETCMTMNDTWGFKSYDDKWKSTETLLFQLVDIISKGGNYLLNVGPTAEGLIPQPSVERLAEVGAWMKINSEAIYAAGKSCFGVEYGQAVDGKTGYGGKTKINAARDWRCTTQPGKIYIHFFKWPGTKFEVAGMKATAAKAYMLTDRKPLAVSQNGDKLTVILPETAPGKIASVLCVETK